MARDLGNARKNKRTSQKMEKRKVLISIMIPMNLIVKII